MEKVVVRGVAVDKDQAKVTITNIPDQPGSAAKVFNGVANLSFTVPGTETHKAKKALEPVFASLGGGQVEIDEAIAKLSVVGVGMKTHSGVAATLFTALAEAGVNIQLISTSEIKISVLIDKAKADDAARVAHKAFSLENL